MTVIDKLSSSLGRKDEGPNKKLAEQLLKKKDKKSIEEIASTLTNTDPKIQKDCLSVFEYIGDASPNLISKYVDVLLDLTQSTQNSLVWGAMIALARMTNICAKEIFERIDEIIKATDAGSVITKDNGIKIMAKVSAANKGYEKKLYPLLLNYLKKCRPKSVAQFAESISETVNDSNQNEFVKVLEKRISSLNKSQQTRVSKVLKKFS
jgi:hypothetical protein